MNTTHPPLDSFESALLAELRQHVVDHPATATATVVGTPRAPRSRRLRLAASAAAVGTAASVAAVLGLGLGGGSPAYAVDKDSSGDVVVTIHRLDDAAGLERALAADGVDADVSYDQDGLGQHAQAGPDAPGPDTRSGDKSLHVQKGGSDSGPSVSGGDPDQSCGPLGTPPATLTHDGGDWVLRIPAGSVMLDRHVDIGTDADGTLLVQYAGSQPGSFCGVMTTGTPPS